jgi:hypothetical protein
MVVVAAVVVPTAVVLSAGTGGGHPVVRSLAGISSNVQCCSEIVTAAGAGLRFALAGDRYVVSSPPGESLVFSASAADRSVRRVLPVGVAVETGLQVKTILAARAVSMVFPEIEHIGGVRADYLKWHPNGLAIDVMISNYDTDEGKVLGNEIVAFALANADRFGLDHVIWRQTIWSRRGAPHMMGNYGSDDANHYTHVHIATDGGGYPMGRETYLR